MAPRFAIVGDNTVDRYLDSADKGRALDFVGGNAVNVAAQLALAGKSVGYYGAVGDDADGEFVQTTLSDLGVNLDGLIVAPGSTALTRIRVDADGERIFESEDFGVTDDYFPSDTDLDKIAAADWVQLGMVRRASELRRALRLRRDVPIGQDCAVAEGYGMLRLAFDSVGSDDPWPVAHAARARGASLAVVTRGALGAVAVDSLRVSYSADAVPTEAVDTTGAGDSFIAGFISSYLEASTSSARGVSAALQAGTRWAAVTCGHRGGFRQDGRKAA